ncbi:putative thioredoxin 1 [Paratrimastix pyriformis]|uniref:Thioredoxin 1 n=1 Tax=Paratrimastix pyriformis TaxID=342808 RepID=A0ABQ8UNQ0_9EUKA|nr:putative thioredoxin 1 [Paratrimastix pyriformis]
MHALLTFLVLAVTAAFAKNIVVLSDSNFDSVIGKGRPAFVKFYGESCYYCKQMAPEFKRLNNMNQTPYIIAEVNSSENPALSARYNIQGVPTLILFSASSTRPLDFYPGDRTAPAMMQYLKAHQ